MESATKKAPPTRGGKAGLTLRVETHRKLMHKTKMVGTSLIEERAEAEHHLAEAMRITNDAVRRAHKLGRTVDAQIITMHTGEGLMPQLTFGTTDRQRGAI